MSPHHFRAIESGGVRVSREDLLANRVRRQVGAELRNYRLKFEGEEDDKEMEVDRRFVLDILGK
jgi:hypothetical protein